MASGLSTAYYHIQYTVFQCILITWNSSLQIKKRGGEGFIEEISKWSYFLFPAYWNKNYPQGRVLATFS